MEQEIKKLREAGFTDADIEVFVNDQKTRQGQPSAVDPAQVDASQPAMADEKVPAYGAPPDTSMLETVGTVGAAVAPYALPATLGVGGLGAGYGIYKGASKALDVGRDIASGMRERNAIDLQRENRLGVKQQSVLGAGKAPVVPSYNVPTTNMPNINTPMAPTAPAPAPAQPQQMQAAKSVVQKLALDKILKGAGVAGAVYGLGQGLFYTSPEEIAILKAAEARKRAQAQGQR